MRNYEKFEKSNCAGNTLVTGSRGPVNAALTFFADCFKSCNKKRKCVAVVIHKHVKYSSSFCDQKKLCEKPLKSHDEYITFIKGKIKTV